jgi:hypothetical protein
MNDIIGFIAIALLFGWLLEVVLLLCLLAFWSSDRLRRRYLAWWRKGRS